MAQCASEISLICLVHVCLNENVGLVNDNFQSGASVFQNVRLQD